MKKELKLHSQAKYIKLCNAETSHKYVIEQFTEEGEFLTKSEIRLQDLDKYSSNKKLKLRIRAQRIWGVLTNTSILLSNGPR